ncbi:peptide ABC transporter ATP-binding protein [Thioclava sediminum]|uniref:Peptide ABC transporter ATP-binding protein n=1 Tax=Thioclava sediminum TaxID=1915319 RepID=A0ABX3MYR7_9RHOB|nr:dipeptide ABC transporter ATP-binding protein [Thioclava sediminum]OOY23690.1 peptide ABC transporter ATP-binding protein [Thioclava sediminum]
MSVILEGRDITRDYIVSGGFLRGAKTIRALHGISFSLEQGKTLAIVGESGCGKSTLARILTLIDPANSGDLYIQGEKIDIKETKVTSALRAKVQIVFQNPYSSLNPRQKVGEVLTEPLIINTDIPAKERRKRAEEMLEKVGLERQHYNRYPHMFSGDQRQRIAIARALMLNPQILVLDEPVSALDLSVQAQVLNLLKDLQDEFDLSYIFVSHDLSVVRYFADEVMVMNAGEVVEYASRDQIFANPQHEYTKTLLAATPIADVEKIRERVERRKAFLAAES